MFLVCVSSNDDLNCLMYLDEVLLFESFSPVKRTIFQIEIDFGVCWSNVTQISFESFTQVNLTKEKYKSIMYATI